MSRDATTISKDAATGSALESGLAITVCFLVPIILNQGAFDHLLKTYLHFPTGTTLVTFGLFVAVVCLQIWLGQLSRSQILLVGSLFLLCAYFAATSFWGDSVAYANRKISLGLSLPIANFVAGIAVARLGKIKWFLIASLILGATFAFSWTNYASAEAYWEQSAAGQAETNITYQGVAYVIGLGALAAGLIAWQTRKPIALLLLSGLFIFLSIKLFGSGGRGGILYLVAGIAAYFLASQPITRIAAAAGSGLFVMIIFVSTFDTMRNYMLAHGDELNLPFSVQRMVMSVYIQQDDERPGEVTRGYLKDRAKDVWGEAPFFGVGWGSFPLRAGLGDKSGFYPHNLVMELLAETGVLGLGLFLTLVSVICLRFAKSGGSANDRSTTWAIFAAAIALSMVSADFPNQRLLFFALGLMTGMPLMLRQSTQAERARESFA